MEIFGYSERGIINSLFYELKFSQNNLQLLNVLLSLISFLSRTVTFRVSDAKILIEQSFSDFGDADVVLLLNNQGDKQVVFMEAKVKTFHKSYRSAFNIQKEFDEFEDGRRVSDPPKGFTSNLFVQLYFKVRLIKALQEGGIEKLQEGVEFPKCLSKRGRKTHERTLHRKIGNNDVVVNAVEQLKGYCNDALFVVLVPDDISDLKDFYQDTLKKDYGHEGFPERDIENWGYVTWVQIEKFCKRYSLRGTLEVFEWNKRQIYEKDKATADNRSYLTPCLRHSAQIPRFARNFRYAQPLCAMPCLFRSH